jgi:hypothetical protein
MLLNQHQARFAELGLQMQQINIELPILLKPIVVAGFIQIVQLNIT